MKAKKFIESKTKGEYETKKYHVIDIDVEKAELDKIVDKLDIPDDYEEASTKFGVLFDGDGEICFIEIGLFVKATEGWMTEREAEGDEVPEYFDPVLDKLKNCDGKYTLYL